MPGDADSVFTKIIERQIPADILYEDDLVVSFPDINPQAPVHLLIVPRITSYANVTELAAADPALLAHIVEVAQHLADERCDGEYRLVFNTGPASGQTIFHVHAHLLGGGLEEGTLARG